MNNQRTPKLTVRQTARYLKNPELCPMCNSKNIEAYALDVAYSAEEPDITQAVLCHNCDARWLDIYTLTAIRVLNPGHHAS